MNVRSAVAARLSVAAVATGVLWIATYYGHALAQWAGEVAP